jgi:D-aminopeptidase
MTLDRRQLLGWAAAGWWSRTPVLAALAGGAGAVVPPNGPRVRLAELGVRIGRLPSGPHGAITDVPGVAVGHHTVLRGSGAWQPGVGPVRTGLTVILPTPAIGREAVAAGYAVPNGNGELSGLETMDRLGVLASPIAFTGTSQVGVVHQALAGWLTARWEAGVPGAPGMPWPEPVVGETWDGELSDVVGRHLDRPAVEAALTRAAGGPVVEGAVGGGTGMICYGWKGGIGTASRRLPAPLAGSTVGVLVQANHGVRELLRIDGVAVGAALAAEQAEPVAQGVASGGSEQNSILIAIATDVPLLDHELVRVARRAVHGLARTGSISANSSGDFAVAFSTANRVDWATLHGSGRFDWATVDQQAIQGVFEATAEATEEAILNALCMAETMTGKDDLTVQALPLDRVVALLAGRCGG